MEIKKYTQTEIDGMTQEQLKAALIKVQEEQAPTDAATNTAEAVTQPADTPVANNQETAATTQQSAPLAVEPTPFEKLTAKIDDLESDGTGLYDAAIAVLKQQRDKLLTDAHAAAIAAENDAKEVTEDAEQVAVGMEAAEKSFSQKYGQTIAHSLEIAALAFLSARALGWI